MSCWCGVPVKETTSDEGVTYVRCGFVVDKKVFLKKIATCTTKAAKFQVAVKSNLGCNLNMVKEDFERIAEHFEFKKLPLCEHKLRCKVGITQVKRSKEGGVDCPGKVFYACPVRWPDIDCGKFEFVHKDGAADGSSFASIMEQSSRSIKGEMHGGGGEGEEEEVKKKKKKKKHIIYSSSEEEEEESSSESDSSDEEEKKKRKKKKKKGKHGKKSRK